MHDIACILQKQFKICSSSLWSQQGWWADFKPWPSVSLQSDSHDLQVSLSHRQLSLHWRKMTYGGKDNVLECKSPWKSIKERYKISSTIDTKCFLVEIDSSRKRFTKVTNEDVLRNNTMTLKQLLYLQHFIRWTPNNQTLTALLSLNRHCSYSTSKAPVPFSITLHQMKSAEWCHPAWPAKAPRNRRCSPPRVRSVRGIFPDLFAPPTGCCDWWH